MLISPIKNGDHNLKTTNQEQSHKSKTTEDLKKIKALLLDVDGVLTDGSIIYNDKGEETKNFNVRDGLGLRLLMDAGIHVCIVTGRSSNALLKRCENLGITHIFDNVSDKSNLLSEILKKLEISAEETAFVGDDLPDLKIMKSVGFSFTVSDAHEILLQHADYITKAKGGSGAVREICELILKTQGIWEKSITKFL